MISCNHETMPYHIKIDVNGTKRVHICQAITCEHMHLHHSGIILQGIQDLITEIDINVNSTDRIRPQIYTGHGRWAVAICAKLGLYCVIILFVRSPCLRFFDKIWVHPLWTASLVLSKEHHIFNNDCPNCFTTAALMILCSTRWHSMLSLRMKWFNSPHCIVMTLCLVQHILHAKVIAVF